MGDITHLDCLGTRALLHAGLKRSSDAVIHTVDVGVALTLADQISFSGMNRVNVGRSSKDGEAKDADGKHLVDGGPHCGCIGWRLKLEVVCNVSSGLCLGVKRSKKSLQSCTWLMKEEEARLRVLSPDRELFIVTRQDARTTLRQL